MALVNENLTLIITGKFQIPLFYNTMKDKFNKFLEVEDRVFRAPYNFLKEKGIIDKVKEIKTRFVEIYAKDEEIPYGGNQMFFGDD